MGRKPKPVLSIEEQEDDVVWKVFTGEPLTLEETALALWMSDGRPKEGPMTKIQIYNIQQRALAKLKHALAKKGVDRSSIDEFAYHDKLGEYSFEISPGTV